MTHKKTTLRIRFNTELSIASDELIREMIEDGLGVEILDITELVE